MPHELVRTRPFRTRWLIAAAVSGLVLGGTGLAAAGAAPSTPSAAGKITYTSRTVEIPTATVKSQLLSVSKDGSTYTFKGKNGALKHLAKGKVMLLDKLAVRDVTKTSTSHGHFVVESNPAALTDLIANGTLDWSKSLDFKDGFGVGGPAVPETRADARTSGLGGLAGMFGLAPMRGSGGLTFKGKLDGYKYSINFKQEKNSLAVKITISRDKPIDLEVSITGTLDNLKTAGNVSVKHGKFGSAKMLANNLKGKFKLEYSAKPTTAFGLGSDGGFRIDLPGEIAVPFFVGPIPFFLGVKVGFFASVGFSNKDQEISGSYTFDYDGAGGFHTSKSGATSAEGVLKGLADIVLNAANAVKNGPLSFIFGAQMPELELGLGVKGLNVAGNLTLAGSTGISLGQDGNANNCDTRQMEITGTAGAEANFFGFSASLPSATLFDKKVEAAHPKGCGVFPGG
jgi:hypothetical protein